jgi:transcription antitermination protein NusB
VARTREWTRPASRRDPDAGRVVERRAPSLDDGRERGRVVEWRADACRGIAGARRRAGREPEPVRDPPMMTRRSRGREVALQVLYQVEQNAGVPLAEVRLFIQRRLLGDRKLCEFTEGLISGVKEHQVQIDALISEAAENWRLDRMAAIDRNILRLGAYEMMFCPEVPARVAINEALELAKRYSTAQSSRFVNGILDRVLQSQVQGPKAEI